MCEDRSSTLLIPLVTAGARIAASTRSGRRFVLVVGHERQPISAALALKLEREGHIRPVRRWSGKTLWVVQHLRRRAGEVIARGPIHPAPASRRQEPWPKPPDPLVRL